MPDVRFLAVEHSNGGKRHANISLTPADASRLMMADPILVADATATVDESWNGRMVRFSQGCELTIPPDLPLHFSCGWRQEGADPITFTAGDGVTLQSLDDAEESAGQYSMGGIAVFVQNIVALGGALA